MIRENQKITIERTVCTCDRCGREITQEEKPDEWQERFAIRFRGGYGSVFGDGNTVEGDFCQNCIHDVLGKYCRIKIDDPFRPELQLHGEPEKIYQPSQLDFNEQAEAFRQRVEDEIATSLMGGQPPL